MYWSGTTAVLESKMSNTIEFIDEFFGLLKEAYDMEFKPGPDRREAFSFASAEYEKGTDITEAVESFVEAFGKTLESATLESTQASDDLKATPKTEESDEDAEARKDAQAVRTAAKGKKKAKKAAKKKVTKKVAKKAAAKKVTKKVAKKVAKKTAKKKATGTRGPSKAMQAYHAFIEWGEGGICLDNATKHDVAVAKAEADKEAAITAIQEALDTKRNNAGTYLSRFRRNDLPAKSGRRNIQTGLRPGLNPGQSNQESES